MWKHFMPALCVVALGLLFLVVGYNVDWRIVQGCAMVVGGLLTLAGILVAITTIPFTLKEVLAQLDSSSWKSGLEIKKEMCRRRGISENSLRDFTLFYDLMRELEERKLIVSRERPLDQAQAARDRLSQREYRLNK